MISRFRSVLLLALAAACAPADPPPAASEPAESPSPAEPEPTLRERWSAPFAVRSSGELPPRPERPETVHLAPEVAAPPALDSVPPPPATEPPPDTTRATPPRRADAPARTHTVSRGDTLWGIARRYGVSAAAIRTANDLGGDTVRLGQTLFIPAAG